MSWRDASLSGLLWNKEEVEALVVLLVLNEVGIDDAAWWRVVDGLTIRAFDEHPLVDPFVDDYQSDWRNTCDGIIDRLEGLFELRDLLFDDLVSLSFANTISVDDYLGGQVALILIGEALDGIDHASVKVLLHDFLILWLNDDV